MTASVFESLAPPIAGGRIRLRSILAVLVFAGVVIGGLYVARDPAVRAVTWSLGTARVLIWLIALLPGLVILNHVVYLTSSRRKQFRQALGKLDATQATELENLYFGYAPMVVRYIIPAISVTVLSALAMTALSNPGCYLTWLYTPAPGASGAPASAVAFNTLCTAESFTSTISPNWPAGWANQILTGAGLGFVGAYVYLLILLTDRARQRDVTTGIAVWAAAMPVLGPVMGGVSALLIVSGTGTNTGSFTQYAVFFVAGMLPRQFAMLVQSGVSKMFQDRPEVKTRTLPLTVLRGIGADVAMRLEEEGIADVSSLAYASPHQLIRGTTYAPRQIADWIDEALLTVNLPSHWEAIEKVGVTGAMDLAWYVTRPDSIKTLADEIKINPTLLENIVERLAQDAQVRDLYTLYWDHSNVAPPLPTTPPSPNPIELSDGTTGQSGEGTTRPASQPDEPSGG